MHAILLPDGKLLIPAEAVPGDDTDAGDRFHEIGPEHADYGRWLALARPGPDPRNFPAVDRRTWIPREADLPPEGWRS